MEASSCCSMPPVNNNNNNNNTANIHITNNNLRIQFVNEQQPNLPHDEDERTHMLDKILKYSHEAPNDDNQKHTDFIV